MGIKRSGNVKHWTESNNVNNFRSHSDQSPPPLPPCPSSKPSSPTIPWCCGRDETATALNESHSTVLGSNWKKTVLVENVLLKGNWEDGGDVQ
jgi:hypothetical protein